MVCFSFPSLGSRGRLLLILYALVPAVLQASSVACVSNETDVADADADAFCERILRRGSRCVDGFCTNPFYDGGCLKSLLPDLYQNKTRVCNSQDPPEAEALGYCRKSPMDYVEVRLAGRNWESIMFGAWVVQILLSELLEVPTSIEGGFPEVNLNFYQVNSAFDFWNTETNLNFSELVTAERVKDCVPVTTVTAENPDGYQPCFHLNSEVWWGLYGDQDVQGIDTVSELGALAEGAIFVPLFAVKNDSTLATYVGLSGPENRRKLAETFRTPFRWKQYCDEVSPTKCEEPDSVAARAPESKEEELAFYMEGLYIGHFRATDKQDCDRFPNKCTGEFIESPCDWGASSKPLFYHLDIALDSTGPQVRGHYPYEEQTQIALAANATKSPIMIFLYTSDPIYEAYMNTDTQFQRVAFPPPTQDCIDNQPPFFSCSEEEVSMEEFVGAPEGACDSFPQVLKKISGTAFRDITVGEDIAPEFWSPAYEAFDNFRFTTFNIYEILELWRNRETDQWGYDPRDATCQWVAENLELVKSFVPKGYPRVVDVVDSTQDKLSIAALAVAIVAIILVVCSTLFTFLKRNTKVLYYTQTEFLYLLLFGMLCVSTAALLLATPLSNETCSAIHWLTNLGFVFQLIPLCLRISAINNLVTSGKKMQRVRLRLVILYGSVAVAAILVAVFVLIWTILDDPERRYEYRMTTRTTGAGEEIVEALDYCGSENAYWYLITAAWLGLILVPSCMIAWVSSRVKEDMNDTRAMSYALYSHAIFLVLMIVAFVPLYESDKSKLMGFTSLIFSFDTIFSIVIYIIPKFVGSGENLEAEPLPDVFVHTTIALIEVGGFAAWSSVREPVQIFQFLELLYEMFDGLADRHDVYKVETVAETYVAATGIPSAQHDHAVLMAKFVIDCSQKMHTFVKKLECRFGPDTGDLTLRIAVHSGPVTGGFLKGKGARFQIFGETITTANLIRSTGLSGRIHVSEEAADLLTKAGKRRWLVEREEPIQTFERGEMKTFWLVKGKGHGLSDGDNSTAFLPSTNHSESEGDDDPFSILKSEQRWIEWNLEVFKNLLKKKQALTSTMIGGNATLKAVTSADMPLDEVKEIIQLPKFDKRAARRQRDNENIEVPPEIVAQLKEYITEIAKRYNPNPFHNFAHASYVVMALQKYLNRILAGSEADLGEVDDLRMSRVQAALHSHTYGITSDPLTQFACVFSALIHDVDHPGVPNPQLIKEDQEVANKYKNRSVAEQKSFDIAWELLMEERFSGLLSAICRNSDELARFRQLVVNSIMATDLGDQQLKELRNGRWEKAFMQGTDVSTTGTSSGVLDEESVTESLDEQFNRKATIVIEHLIQAADVAHMSQHWSIYRKWNERLFREMYKAYRAGRAEANPADSWYKGEIGFFDFYIIPLSRKLRDCGVFGATSAENLNYAMNNRKKWETEGEEIVKEMLKRVEAEYNEEMEAPRPEEPRDILWKLDGEELEELVQV